MATTAAGARASRRAAAARASSQPAPEPEIIDAESTPVVDPAAVEDAFGPESVAPAPDSAAKPDPFTLPQVATAVAVRPASAHGGALTVPGEDLTRKIDAGDLLMPKLRISQAMSKTNTEYATTKGKSGVGMGSWYVSTTGKDLGDTVYFVPVDMRKSRAMFITGEGLVCRSFDMLQGEGTPGVACEGTYEERLTVPEKHRGCPLRLWNDRTPPKCGETYNFPGYLIEDIDAGDKSKLVQVILQLRSTGASCGKAINTMVMNEGGGVWQNTIVELGLEAKSNARGTFFVPTADFYDTTDQPEFARIRRRADAMARQMGAVSVQQLTEDDTE